MPSLEGHIHWSGSLDETVVYLDQSIQITQNPADAIAGGLSIRQSGSGQAPLSLPNSSNASPRWDNIPGTNPALQARQDGHYPTSYIRIRQA